VARGGAAAWGVGGGGPVGGSGQSLGDDSPKGQRPDVGRWRPGRGGDLGC
jgi:hypothetical protein